MSAARRTWGWHPLVDEWAARVVADSGVRPGELVVDAGAGTGALTRHLIAAGARVLAVELHPIRARSLRDRFAGAPVTVVQADILEIRWPARPFRVVASPPFGITSPLLRLLLRPGSRLHAADLVLQRAVVRRYATRPDRHWSIRTGRPLPRGAFDPPPQVDSAVLVVRRRA
ncbi:MAG TPA: rRNA adenine N-6-methyltransferase family protein [Actinophytocola sp.]|uniref:rRNA adenine N-6-methyltransferase family protein n=1 Tax=Actinophytocola sp. TaxID=1872138 RepID=UPI002DB95386|nr:rRNA adenine N-6-methyltransferase family protein [Actinophytocola sp.]HEU5470286.1 rRNA adenine N-6-methyltransferase family protein [Actinophytocola sp.]